MNTKLWSLFLTVGYSSACCLYTEFVGLHNYDVEIPTYRLLVFCCLSFHHSMVSYIYFYSKKLESYRPLRHKTTDATKFDLHSTHGYTPKEHLENLKTSRLLPVQSCHCFRFEVQHMEERDKDKQINKFLSELLLICYCPACYWPNHVLSMFLSFYLSNSFFLCLSVCSSSLTF